MADVLDKVRNQLVITFKTESGDTYNFTMSNPKDDISEAEIKEIAQCILDNNIFLPSIGAELNAFVKAKVVNTETDQFDLTV